MRIGSIVCQGLFGFISQVARGCCYLASKISSVFTKSVPQRSNNLEGELLKASQLALKASSYGSQGQKTKADFCFMRALKVLDGAEKSAQGAYNQSQRELDDLLAKQEKAHAKLLGVSSSPDPEIEAYFRGLVY